jgi:hypothetical protein
MEARLPANQTSPQNAPPQQEAQENEESYGLAIPFVIGKGILAKLFAMRLSEKQMPICQRSLVTVFEW